MKTRLLTGYVLGLLVVGLLVQGCGPLGRTVNITATPELCSKSVEVHLIGVNRFDTEWESMSMTDYWKPGNRLHKEAAAYTHRIKFGGKEPCQVTVKSGDDIRSVWRRNKAEYMFVLAHLTGDFKDAPGNADARRLRLPAPDAKGWGLTQNKIDIVIESTKIRCLTIPK